MVLLGTATEASASNDRRQVDQAWAAFSSSVAAIEEFNAHGNWVEPYCMANPFFDSPPGRRAAGFAAFDGQPTTFLGILCGEFANSDTMQIAMSEFVQKSEDRVSRRTLDLKPWLEQTQDVYSTHTDPPPLTSPLSIFDPVKPVFRRNHGMSLSGEDMTWRSNYYAARSAKAPGFPEPRGGYHPLGTINQYSCPTYPDNENVGDASLPMVDMLSLTFWPDAFDAARDQSENFLQSFRQFRQDVAALDHCEALHWSLRQGQTDVAILFIVWRSGQDRPHDLMAVCNPLLQRSGILSHMEREPSWDRTFPITTRALISLQMTKHLELATFSTRNDPKISLTRPGLLLNFTPALRHISSLEIIEIKSPLDSLNTVVG